MALPEIEVRVSADTRQAEAGLGRVNERLGQVAGSAPTAQRAATGFGGSLRNLGNVSNQTRSRIQQVSFQLQDVAVQMQAGTRASVVMAQQLPQMAGAFGAVGAAIGVVIALGVPLAAFLLGGARNGRSMAQVMDALAEAVENADNQFSGLSDSLSDLVAIGGQYSARAMDIAQAQRQIAFHDAAAALSETADALSGSAGMAQFSSLLGLIEQGLNSIESAADRQGLQRLIENYQGQLDDLAFSMGMSVEGATVLSEALQSLAAAQGPTAQARAAQNAAEAFLAAAGSVDEMTESERQIYAQLLQTEQAALRLQAIEERRSVFIADQGRELSRQINLQRTILQYGEDSEEVERLRAEIARQEYQARLQSNGVAGDQLQTLMGLYDEQARLTTEAERTAEAVNLIANSDLSSFEARVAALAQELGIAADEAARLLRNLPVGMTYGNMLNPDGDLLPPGSPASGGGGGGGGSAFGGRIAALVESLQTERETLEVWYEESLALLGQANEAELEAIGGHNEARLRLEEEYQSRLAAIRGAGHGDALTSVLQSGQRIATAIGQTNERAMRVAQAFGAAEALVNAYRAASQVLADPTLPWFAKASAAAGVLAAGIGFANSIKSIGAGGGGGGAVGGGAVSGGAAQSPQVSRNVAIQLTGGNMFSRDQVLQLINAINESVEDGAIVRVV